MDISVRKDWLQSHTLLGTIAPAALSAIATHLQETHISANRRLVLEDTVPDALYILYSGHVESYRTSPNSMARAVGMLPGSVLYLKELLLNQTADETSITLDDCVLWQVSRDEFLAIAQQHPEIAQALSKQLATDLQRAESELAYERDRSAALRPYVVPKVRRGIVGSSRYAVRLRQDIKKATQETGAVLILGEPGLNKDNIAALIHFGSRDRKEPLIKVNCSTLQANGVELFGRGTKPGLLEWIGHGTVMLNNLEDLPTELLDKLKQLLNTGEYTPVSREDTESLPKQTEARIMMIAEKVIPQISQCKLIKHSIKVPPLRVRKADIKAQVEYYLGLLCRSRGLSQPKVTPEALRRLQGYDFPGNLTELDNLLARALVQAGGATELTEEVFWAAGGKERRFRVNLLNAYPWLRRFLRSEWYPDRINYGLTLVGFALAVAILLFGPQSRDRNFVLNLFWDWWWLGSLLIFPFLGRIWCAFCPFMIYGELVQKLSLKWFPRQLRSWPRQEAERIGGWFLFGLFALILLWEELWDLENTAYLSGCLLLLITAGAVIFSLLFERRFWCRYLCPIGGMNGMFAKLSMIELRAQQGICSATCTTYQCYKGGSQKGEGQETGGCPIYSHPAQLQDNKDCVLCMTCLKACPHRSVELNLRPPGIELWTTHKANYPEVALLFLLFGATFLHRLPEIEQQLGLNLHLENFGSHTLVSIAALLVPIAIALPTHFLIRLLSSKHRPFVELAYGYLPLAMGGLLAHFLRLGLSEGGQIIPVTFATFGLATANLPLWIAHPAVVAFLQTVALFSSVLASVVLTQKIARQPFLKLLPQHFAGVAIALLMGSIIVGW
ncbi:MAG: sigma 54-interacting transcriptional regulator [Timaviella obliquedivisa GSE-PSE-MK23-08B]|jgi:transcriptional regulator with AAA-type ATPase domain/NAD-dependent dihydropyrimidine dehydrogenase PreA subunit|nr:sigma 54-interacting transcriptional regulator [Timaviella obliquedivisa GSE-PSE-MK23-08B]